MLGNVWEWTFDRRQPYPSDGTVTGDVEDSLLHVSNDVARTRRGGSFAYEWFTVRSAHRGDVTYFPNQTRDGVGISVLIHEQLYVRRKRFIRNETTVKNIVEDIDRLVRFPSGCEEERLKKLRVPVR